MYQFYVERNYTRAPEYRFGVPQQFGIFYALGKSNLSVREKIFSKFLKSVFSTLIKIHCYGVVNFISFSVLKLHKHTCM